MIDAKDRIVEALYRVVQTVQNVGDLPLLLKMIMEESKHLLGAEASSLFLYDPEKNDLYFEVVVGEKDKELKKIRVPMGQGFVGAAATERRTEIVNDVASDRRHFTKADDASGFVTRNLIAAPMMRKGDLIGVLEVLNKSGEAGFDPMDSKVLEIMAEHAASAIQNARLIQANIQAERLAALGTAQAKIAHYVKNILTQFDGSASLIDMALATGRPHIIEEAWPITKRAKNKISKLVSDMLRVSRERKPELETVDVNAVVRGILEDSAARAEQAEVKLVDSLDENLPSGQLDPNTIHDSLLNIVGNAIEALEESGIQDGEVSLSTFFVPERDLVRIVIEDNGPGIPEEVQTRIFEPFFSTKGSRGTGLGLAVVKKTIEEHGGRIELDSEIGRGTRFTIELPYEEA